MGNSQILFGNVDLGICSQYFEVVDIKDSGVDRPIIALDPPGRDGHLFGSMKNGIRTITITFTIHTEDTGIRFDALKRLNMIVASKTPMQLIIPNRVDMYLTAVCSVIPAPSVLDWTEELQLQFVAHDPFYRPIREDIVTDLVAGGSAKQYIECPGVIKPQIYQTIAATLTDPTWTCSNGQTIMLAGSVAAGALIIDCDAGDIKLAGVSILGSLAVDSQFFKLAMNPVTNMTPYTITCSNGAAGQLRARSRWL